MSPFAYKNFTVALGSKEPGRYTARVVDAPYRGSLPNLELPYGPSELEAVLGSLGHQMLHASAEPTRHVRSAGVAPVSVEPATVGAELFRALFHGPLLKSLMKSQGSVESSLDGGLRLRLLFDPSEAGLAQLGRLPWELLFDEGAGDFLSRNPATPIVRDWAFPRRAEPPKLLDRLRVLVVIADSPRKPRLDLETELDRIEEIWRRRHIEVDVLTNPTLGTLQETLKTGRFQVLHFMGHGDFDHRSSQGVLYVDPRDTADPRDRVSGPGFAEVVKGTRSLYLVVLNACDTAQFSARPEEHGHTGLAAALLQAGVPAVVGMQFPISDGAAKVFSEALYSSLAAGEVLETAVTRGRRAIFREYSTSFEWATPVLYMSLREGYIFDVTSGRLHVPIDHRLVPPPGSPIIPPPPSQSVPEPAIDESNLRKLLVKVKKAWVDGVLERSLRNRAAIALATDDRADLVRSPLARILETADQERTSLPSDLHIGEIFAKHGTLLILGEPGSGKTTTLLELARHLIARAEAEAGGSVAGRSVPVIFNLSSWTRDRRRLDDWLVEELNSKYRIPHKLGRSWLDGGRLLALLDGLDEVPFEHRAACVAAINEFARSVGLTGLAVCSRLHEYQVLPDPLQLDAAVLLRPLTGGQIDAYLQAGGEELAELQDALRDDFQLRVLAQTPLMLNVMGSAYHGGERPPELESTSLEERRRHVLDAYIDRALGKSRGRALGPSRDEALQKLAWLARTLSSRNQKIFMVESLQPELLKSRSLRLVYVFLSRLLIGLPVGAVSLFGEVEDGKWVARLLIGSILWSACTLSSFLVDALRFEGFLGALRGSQRSRTSRSLYFVLGISVFTVIFTVAVTLFFNVANGFAEVREMLGRQGFRSSEDWGGLGLLFGSMLGGLHLSRGLWRNYSNDIQTVETLRWSLSRAMKSARAALVPGIVTGLFFGAFALYIESDLELFLVQGPVVFACFSGFFGFVFGGFSVGSLDSKDRSNQGIILSLKRSLFVGGVVFIPFCFGAVIAGEPGDGGWFAVLGLLFAWVVANWYGGLDVTQHYILRFLLFRQGHVPFRYPRFLDQAARRALLQKVGGGYIFIHRLFQEHFAAMDEAKPR